MHNRKELWRWWPFLAVLGLRSPLQDCLRKALPLQRPQSAGECGIKRWLGREPMAWFSAVFRLIAKGLLLLPHFLSCVAESASVRSSHCRSHPPNTCLASCVNASVPGVPRRDLMGANIRISDPEHFNILPGQPASQPHALRGDTASGNMPHLQAVLLLAFLIHGAFLTFYQCTWLQGSARQVPNLLCSWDAAEQALVDCL